MRWIVLIGLLLLPIESMAKTTRESSYRYQQVWNTAVRFIRVDNGFEILEKDKDSGYMMFTYTDGGTSQTGAVELFKTERNAERLVSIGLRISNMPSYVEGLLLDKLERKLRDEYGDPPRQTLKTNQGRQGEVTKREDDSKENEKSSSDEATDVKKEN